MRPSRWPQAIWLIAVAIASCTEPVLAPEPSVPAPDLVLTEPQTQGSADAGTIDTTIGTFSWRHLIGDVHSLPHPEGDIVITPSGYAAIEHTWDPLSSDVILDYWHSPNGYEWTPGPLPVPVKAQDGASLQELSGGFWLTTWNPGTLWRSGDGETWLEVPLPDRAKEEREDGMDDRESVYDVDGTVWLTSSDPPGVWRLDDESWLELDTSALIPPDIAGLEWSLTWPAAPPTRAVTVGNTTVFRWELGGSVDYRALGFGDLYGVWDPATRTMGLYRDGRTPVRTLSVEAEGNRFIFIDEAEAVVHEITINDDRIKAATLLDSPSFGNFHELSLGILDGQGRITASIPPWGGFDTQSDVQLLAVDDQFLAFVQRGDPTGSLPAELWTSTDGLSWSGPQRPGFLPEEIDYLFSVGAEGDVVLADVRAGDHTEIWVSDDGISWTDTGLSHDSNVGPWSLKPFGSGGIYIGNTATAYEMFVSTDLRTWEQVDTGQLGMRPFPENSGGRMLGAYPARDVIFITLEEDATGTRDMWVLELDR